MNNLSIRQLAAMLRSKQIGVKELHQSFHSRLKEQQPKINAFISVAADIDDDGEQQLDKIQNQLADTNQLLCGIPLAHKDLFCTQDLPTTCGSNMLRQFTPPYNATLVEKLNRQGMLTLGKTNMDEFAMGSSNEHSAFGAVANPWDLNRVPGGSSGGSAAAVVARMVPAATASDTGGSIRQPAALCGVTGIKPSYGRVSRYGMVAFASSLDQAGVMASRADDCGLLLEAMSGHDPLDSTSAKQAQWHWQKPETETMQGLKVGILSDWIEQLSDPQIKQSTEQAIAQLQQSGAEIIEVKLPHAHYAIAAYYVIASAECSSNLSRFDGVRYGHRSEHAKDLNDLYQNSRSEAFGDEVKRRIMVGTWALSSGYYEAYYRQAQKVRRLISQDFAKAFTQVDLIAAPVCPEVAFRHGEKADGVSMYQSDIFTIPASLAGLPCLSMPIAPAHGLPVGLQLIGKYFAESTILSTADKFQQQTDWHLQTPECK